MPKVSVCMPVSRDGAWFRAALRSVLNQTEKDIDIIVSDDSGGSLAAFVASCRDERIRYLANPAALGFSGNHCRALSAAHGEFVAFLHDDDLWEPNYLQLASDVLGREASLGIVLAGAIEIDADDRGLGPRPARMRAGKQADPLSLFLARDFMMLLPSLSLFRSEALKVNARPWPDVIAADLTMYVDAVRAGWGVYYLERPLVRYRTHPGQIGTNDLAHRHALVTVWTSYTFMGRRHERLRRRRVAEALVARAGAHLRIGNANNSRNDLILALRTDAAAFRPRWALLLVLTIFPSLAAPLARLRRRSFDVVANRHGG
jgi:glycosyltransferase involved in cell wall biosynthesis